MVRRISSILATGLLIGIVAQGLHAQTVYDWDGDVDGEWNTAANWVLEVGGTDPASAPDATIRAEIDNATGNTPNIGPGDVAVASEVRIGRNEGAGLLTISGGSLTTGGNRFRVGAADAGGNTGTLVISDGTLTVNNASFVTGSSSKGIINMSGGSILVPTATFDFNMDEGQAGAASVLTMSGGLISVNDVFLVDQFATVNLSGGTILTSSSAGAFRVRRDAVVNVTGGLLETKDDLELGGGTTPGGTINLSGGIVRAFRFAGVPGATGVIDISSSGLLQFLNSQETVTEVQSYITSGYFTTSAPSLAVSVVNVGGLDYTQVMAVPEPTAFLFMAVGTFVGLATRRLLKRSN